MYDNCNRLSTGILRSLIQPFGLPLKGMNLDRASSLLQVVQRTVAPGTWRDSGGSVGAVAIFGNKLVVTHVEKRQREVEALLEQLRAK